ncbi:hypothetical protein [Mycobacteroides franklinii]|uniref:hypothetical protein n=1 Tax=Mycobacteroides franklinii TaxID=948102 RepID=UPI0012FFCAB1|nr:hypothetical protein [Mycobacteroides franklinii]
MTDINAVIERLEMRKVDFLDSARKFPCAGMEYSDHMELLGRAYGIDIALSYLREGDTPRRT